MKVLIGILCMTVLALSSQLYAESNESDSTQTLSLESFVQEACRRDVRFQEILSSELLLRYNKVLKLPSDDILLGVKGQYNFDLSGDEYTGPEGAISLSKLFPSTGTEIYTDYSVSQSKFSSKMNTVFNAYISQPIARNAFGSETRIIEKIVGIENRIMRHQVVEAYEDYLATLIAFYYQWYSDYENMKTAKAALAKSTVLLKNIQARYYNRIANYSDVGQIKLQVLDKKEDLMTLKTKYRITRNVIYQAIRHDNKQEIVPGYRTYRAKMNYDFDSTYQQFIKEGRTHNILELIMQKGKKDVMLQAKALLPSANLLLGYTQEKTHAFTSTYERKVVYGGVQMEFPIFRNQQKAAHQVARINEKRNELSVEGKIIQVRTELQKLSQEIALEKELIDMYKEKVRLSQRVIKAERVKYRQVRSTLKDLIDLINASDEYRFKLVLHQVKYSILSIEWLRMTDQLVTRKEMHKNTKIRTP